MYVFDLKPIPILSYFSITIIHVYALTILSTDGHNFICMHHYLCVNQFICYSLSNCLSPTPSYFLSVCLSLYLSLLLTLSVTHLFLLLSLHFTLSFPSSQSVCHSIFSFLSVRHSIFSFLSVCLSLYIFLPLSLSVTLSFPFSQYVCHFIFSFLSVCLSLYLLLCHRTHLFFAISARIFSPIVFLNNSIFSTIAVRPSDFRSFSRESNFGPNPASTLISPTVVK